MSSEQDKKVTIPALQFAAGGLRLMEQKRAIAEAKARDESRPVEERLAIALQALSSDSTAWGQGAPAVSTYIATEAEKAERVSRKNSVSGRKYRFRDPLARLVYYTVKRLAYGPPYVRPRLQDVIDCLGRTEMEVEECANTLRAHADAKNGIKLRAQYKEGYYNNALVHWWHGNKPRTSTRTQVGDRITTALERLANEVKSA